MEKFKKIISKIASEVIKGISIDNTGGGDDKSTDTPEKEKFFSDLESKKRKRADVALEKYRNEPEQKKVERKPASHTREDEVESWDKLLDWQVKKKFKNRAEN